MKTLYFSFPKLKFLFIVTSLTMLGIAQAEVNVNINLGSPAPAPAIVVVEQPAGGPPVITETAPLEVVLMPGTGIYYVPNATIDIFFFNGFWWCSRGGRWYKSSTYNGTWLPTQHHVPNVLIRIPQNYREIYKRERHMNYKDWHQHGSFDDGRDHGTDKVRTLREMRDR